MMIFIFTVLILSIVYLYFTFSKKSHVPHGLKEIPTERGLPLIGILYKMESPLTFFLKKLGQKHGPMFTIRLGMRDILVLNEYDILKKTFQENGNIFSGRWHNQLFKAIAHNSGIIATDGEVWSKQRAFVLRVLRDFGLGKSKSLEVVQSECAIFLEELEKETGKTVDFAELIPIYTVNIISKFIMNKRFSRKNPKIDFIENLITGLAKGREFVQFLNLTFPFLDHFKPFATLVTIIPNKIKDITKAHSIIQEEIDEHSKRLDFNSEGEDLIDRFLIEQHKLKEKTGSVDTFTDWQLIRNAFELFIAGYETTSTTLGWSMMFMARYPDIQNRVYNEIVDKIGTERLPTMNDKKSLNYTQAVMDEIMRLSSVVPLAIFHRSIEDVSVDDYFIPKNTLIFPNLMACHTDPKIWKKPMEFYPEHFLLSDKNGEEKYNCREELIPFGIGKRQCLGESLARMEYLIFFLSIIQRFEICFANEVDEETFKKAIIGNEGFIRVAALKEFLFKRRI